jgi:hypothetical protein
MSAIPHLFGENIRRIDLPGDMTNLEGTILDPFSNQIFTELNVAGCFGQHVVGPLDACIFVIKENSRGVYVWEAMTRLGNSARQVTKINNLVRRIIFLPKSWPCTS